MSYSKDLQPELCDKSVVIPWSGGLDSTALIPFVIKNFSCKIYPLFISRGQENMAYEDDAVSHYDKIFLNDYSSNYNKVFRIDVSIPPKQFRGYLDEKTSHLLRNSDIINQAVRYALGNKIKTILIGSLPSDSGTWKDGTLQYLESKTSEVRSGTGDVDLLVISPYLILNYEKNKIVSWCNDNGVDLSYSRSCFTSNEHHCGTCAACMNRKNAFELAGVKDTTVYV